MTRQPALLRREGTTLDGRPYLIRPTQPGEAAAILALQDAVAAEGEFIAALPGDREAMEQELLLSGILSSGGLSVSLDVGGTLSGHLLVVRRADHDQTHIGDLAIIVENAARGLGLGRALMETAIDWARAVRLGKLCLAVFTTNERAIGLYRSLGFVDEGVLRRQVRLSGGDRDVLLMGLAL